MTAMTELTEHGHGAAQPEAVGGKTSVLEAFKSTLEVSQDDDLSQCAASEETDSREEPEDSQQGGERDSQQGGERDSQQGGERDSQQGGERDRQQGGQRDRQQGGQRDRQQGGQRDRQQGGETASPPAAESSSTKSKWVVGAQCQAVWSEDGRVYPATVLSVDGERCRVCFDCYGNEEDVELSALQHPDAAQRPPGQNSQDWKPGSRCRAVYSEDGLVYPAAVLWVKGQRCRVRFDYYNNEEEQDLGSLLKPNELHGPNRAAAAKVETWNQTLGSNRKSRVISYNCDRKRREEQDGGGGRRSALRDEEQNSSWVKEKEQKTGNQQRDGAGKPTNHSFSFLSPFPAPPQLGSGHPGSFIPPPPPPPLWTFGGNESCSSPAADAASSMFMLWYMCGFHTSSYMAQQEFRSKD